MDLMKISFGNFDFEINPETLIVEGGEIIENTRSHMFHMGSKLKKVVGEGYFFGDDAAIKYDRLENCAKQGALYLILPNIKPFSAVLSNLQAEFLPEKELLKYKFVFIEANEKESLVPQEIKIAKMGQSLWDFEGEKSIEWLVKNNPHIRYINSLNAGERVKIR